MVVKINKSYVYPTDFYNIYMVFTTADKSFWWGNLTTLLMAGAGIHSGQVIGQSDRQAGEPLGTAYEPKHLLGSVLKTFYLQNGKMLSNLLIRLRGEELTC